MSSTVVSRKQKVSYFLFSLMMDKWHAEVFYITSFSSRLTFEAFSLRETCGSSEHLTTEAVFSMKYEAMIE